MSVLFLIIFVILVSGFGFFFIKNDFDINKTIRYIRVNFLKCCIKDEKELVKTVGEEKIKKLKGDLVDIDDCKEPLPKIPLDLCLSSELEIEELKIREKIFEKLKERDNFIVDGGKNKMILPLEATIFLTKNFNPLVSEEGNILVIAEHKEISGSTEFEEIKLFLKDKNIKNDKGELIYKDDTSILNLIKANINEARNTKETVKEDRRAVKRFDAEKAIDKAVLEEDTSKSDDMFGDIDKEIEEASKSDDMFGDIDKEIEQASKSDDMFGDIDKEIEQASKSDDMFANIDKEIEQASKSDDMFANIDKEIEQASKSDDKKEEISTPEEENFVIDDNPFGEEEIDFSKMDEEISLNMNDLEFDEDEDENEDENERESFYKKLKYKRVSVKNLTKENITETIKDIFKNSETKEAILNNLIKTKPLIFNANKEVIFIDMKNIFFAISKLYGIDSTKKIDLFEKLDIKTITKISRIIATAFEDEISDLISGNKKVNRIILKRENQYYFSFGLFFMTDVFKKTLNDDNFDFFRQYPYNTEYKISENSNKTKTPLTPSIYDCEI